MPSLLPTWNTTSVTALRDFARIRLLAIDVDGTLLGSTSGNVFLNIGQLANRTHLRPVSFVIATGRTLHGVGSVFEQWPAASNSPAILYNGSVVVSPRNSRVKHIQTIPLASVATVLRLCKAHRRSVLAYLYRPNAAPICGTQFEEVYGWSYDWRPETEFNGLRVRWQSQWQYNETANPVALLVRTANTDNTELAEQLRMTESIDLTRSGDSFLEIRPRGSNKGASLSLVASELGLTSECVLALGDNDNDVEMLQWAGIGVAIAEASSDALAGADYVCHYGVARGVVEILRLIRSAHRYYGTETHVGT